MDEQAEFEDSIVEDLALLGVKGDAVTHTSDYFDQLHKLCLQMIEEGNAYADDTEQEKVSIVFLSLSLSSSPPRLSFLL